jgi:xyloglucan-specific exo-beta-1,4-glucanase
MVLGLFDRRAALGVTILVLACASETTPPSKSEPPSAMPAKPVPAPPTAETGPYVWKSVPLLGGGFVTGIVWSTAERDVCYARTDIGGAYRLDRASGTWIPLLDHLGKKQVNWMGVESIATDPTDGARVYLAVGTYTKEWAGNGAIFRSSDYGRTFEISELPIKMGGNEDGRSNGERLAVDPNAPDVLYFGSRRAGLWTSTDGAKRFAKVAHFPVPDDPNGYGLPFVVFDRASGERGKPTPVFYVGVSSVEAHLFVTNDAGKTFAPVPKQPKGMMPSHAAFDANGVLYVSYGNVPGPSDVKSGAVWKFEPKRGAWTDITPLRPAKDVPFGYGGLAVDPREPGTVMVTTLDRWTPPDEIFRTTDGGKRWTALGPKAVRDPAGAGYLYFGQTFPSATGWMGHIAIDPFDSNRALYVTGQGIWGSDDVTEDDRDRPTHWSFRNHGLEETVALALASPPEGAPLLSGVGDINGFRHDVLDTPPKDTFGPPVYANVHDLDFAGRAPSFVVRVGTHPYDPLPKLVRGAFSTDGGATFQPFGSEPEKSKGAGGVAVSSDGATIVWSARGAPVSYSRDRGKTWATSAGLAPPPEKQGWAPTHVRVAADRVNPKRFYAYDPLAGVAYVSTDAGATFAATARDFPTPPDYELGAVSLETVLEREGDVWLTTSDALHRSRDAGRTFETIPGVAGVRSVGFGKAASGRSSPSVYVIATIGGVDGFFRSDDEGGSFVRINDDRHQFGGGLIVTGDPRVSGRVYLGTHGRGIWYGEPAQ